MASASAEPPGGVPSPASLHRCHTGRGGLRRTRFCSRTSVSPSIEIRVREFVQLTHGLTKNRLTSLNRPCSRGSQHNANRLCGEGSQLVKGQWFQPVRRSYPRNTFVAVSE